MKILFQYYNGGGGALENIIILLENLANEYPDDEFVIVCNAASKLNRLAHMTNVRIVVPKEFLCKELTRLQLGFWGLKSIVNKVRPDIVWSMNLGSYVRLKPVNLLSVNNAHQVYPLKDTGSHPKSKFHVILMRFFFRLSLKAADCSITQTEVVKKHLLEISPDKEVYVFTKVVDERKDIVAALPPREVIEKLNSMGGNIPMLYIATNYAHKNHKVILDALDILVRRGKKVSLILSLTEDEAINIGGEIAVRLIKRNYLCCIGWVDKSWLKYLYDFSYICLMPSTLESLSSAHLEAMAWKVPQISSNMPFSHETCRDASLYCDKSNANDWSEMIVKLIQDPVIYRELKNKAELRINEFPKGWKEVAHKYHDMFLHELNRKV
ncbi:glycosyltransferase [Salinivibrio costicola]|uniref:Glycosyl transferase family 1 domain-containing protein n=1 Tax=Salinivibrio costicola subsp. alcaliphilus TaxID=272773 RepID=A0ABX3KN86_SALCS|nr:glycosyltransferase [Salinivibrio costicola]OOF32783.1 hypothetical protein BZJ21_14300 [Salinivibrio costicola subsp. alcaliphilus]